MKTFEIDGKTVRIATALGEDAQQKVIAQTVMPVAIDVYKRKCLQLGNPRVPPGPLYKEYDPIIMNDLLMTHAQGYSDGFVDAVYFILTGKLSVAFCERSEEPEAPEEKSWEDLQTKVNPEGRSKIDNP